MTEQTNTEDTEFNFNEWLKGASRPTRAVTIFAAGELLADVDLLMKELQTEATIQNDDPSDSDGARSLQLQDKIDELNIALHASKITLRVTSVLEEEQEEIREATQKELKDQLDQVAKKARDQALIECKRADVTATAEKNSIVRNAAMAATKHVLDREVNLRVMSKAIVSPNLTPAQLAELQRAVGDSQVGLISKAYTRAALETPKVQLPKSLQPSPSDDGV